LIDEIDKLIGKDEVDEELERFGMLCVLAND